MIADEVSPRVLTRCAVALERACMEAPNGCHEFRQHVTMRLIEASRRGFCEIDELVVVALNAVAEIEEERRGLNRSG